MTIRTPSQRAATRYLVAMAAVPILVGCKQASIAPSREFMRRDVTAPVPAAPTTATESDEPSPDDDSAIAARFDAILCKRDDPSCCVREVIPAGTNRQGQKLTVVTVTDDCDWEDRTKFHLEGVREEYWLMTSEPGGRFARRRVAENGGGPKWEIGVQVDEKARTLSYGGHSLFSFDRWHDDTTIGLDPVRLVAMEQGSFGYSYSYDVTWNWDTFEGSLSFGVDYCPGKAPTGPNVVVDRDAPEIETSALAIPTVTLPTAFTDGGWRTTGLGDCAAHVDSAGRGFLLYGSAGSAGDASFHAVLSDKIDLFVEVEDDHLIANEEDWAKSDHLQIWAAESGPCMDPTAPSSTMEWRVRLVDGRAFAGYGHPTLPLPVESQRDGNRVRLKIPLANAIGTANMLTVAYSDSDDGLHAKRVIATSQLVFGEWWTLGPQYEQSVGAALSTLDAACRAAPDHLVHSVPPPLTDRDETE